MTFYILHSTNGPIDQWTNGPMDQWTNGSMDQWTNWPKDQWTYGKETLATLRKEKHIGTFEHWNIGTLESLESFSESLEQIHNRATLLRQQPPAAVLGTSSRCDVLFTE